MTPSIHLDEQVRAALGRVVHAKDAGGPPDAEDRFLLLSRYSAWLEALEEHFAPVRCSACGGVLPECGLLNHTLRCSRMPPVARAAQLDAELRALEEVADLLGRPLDLAANPTLAGPGPDRPPAKHAGVLRREVSGALRLLLGGNVDLRDALNQRAIGIDELVAITRFEGPRTTTAAVATLEACALARLGVWLAARGRCVGCDRDVGTPAFFAHLAECHGHPEAVRADALAHRLAALGVRSDALTLHVTALHRAEAGLAALLRECEWVASEFGWDGEAAYLDGWAENLFKERVDALRAQALGQSPVEAA